MPPSEIPTDVETRYKEIQEEMRQLQLSPEALQGESREARFEREQRLRALRREFDSMARIPLARRQRTGATVLIMSGIALLLCVISLFGGMALANNLGKAPDIQGTATNFMDAIKTQDYAGAHTYLINDQDASGFEQKGTEADTALGVVTHYNELSHTGGNSGDTSGFATFEVDRAGGKGITGCQLVKAAQYVVVLQFTYVNGSWGIIDYGKLFDLPTC